MNFSQFAESLATNQPPGLPDTLLCLWHDARGDWETAHAIAQEMHSPSGSLLHAYLHRKEGDKFNASYWYNKAGEPVPEVSLEEEWKNLVKRFLPEY